MALTNDFMNAVQEGKTMRVRIMMKDSLLIDPTALQFEEMERYANSQMGSIYVAHDGEELIQDPSAWDQTYLNQQMVAVVGNFSRERVELLKKMTLHLYRDKADSIRSTQAEKHEAQGGSPQKPIGVGVTVGGAVLAAAGVCTSHTALIVGGVAVAAAGVVLIATDKGNH